MADGKLAVMTTCCLFVVVVAVEVTRITRTQLIATLSRGWKLLVDEVVAMVEEMTMLH